MINVRRLLPWLLVFAMSLLLVLLLGIVVGLRLGPRADKAKLHDTPVLLKEIQGLSQLVTVQYVMEKVVIWEDPPTSILTQFIAGDNRLLLLAHGVVKAGIDLEQLGPDDLRVEGKKIVVRLPSPRVTDAYLDEKQTKVIERSTGFLRSFDKDLEQNVRQIAVNEMRSAARRGGILKDADQRARTQLAGLFFQLGFQQVEFELGEPSGATPVFRETSTKPAL